MRSNNSLSFRGKVVLITVAATVIGRAVAVAFAEHGANLVIGDVNEDAAAGNDEPREPRRLQPIRRRRSVASSFICRRGNAAFPRPPHGASWRRASTSRAGVTGVALLPPRERGGGGTVQASPRFSASEILPSTCLTRRSADAARAGTWIVHASPS